MDERSVRDRTEGTTAELECSAAPSRWVVEVGSVDGTTQKTLEIGQRLLLGSAAVSDLRIDDPAVSARHAIVEATARCVRVRDAGSKNGVFVGAARVGEATLDARGGTFVIGRTAVVIRPETPGAKTPTDGLPGMVGTSESMRRLAAEVRRIAPLRGPVLVRGETGTGKDLVARALHVLGRPRGPYLPINASAIVESLADAELFGHARGAFTGAHGPRAGAIRAAHGGTLFIDEIADLALPIQAKLLRVVEDGLVRPVGSEVAQLADVRFVTASWASLVDRVAEGRFRADLLHRISTFTLTIPPLRDRLSDLPALASALLLRLEDEVGTKEVSTAALAKLLSHRFPGNVRELSSVLYRAAVRAPGRVISARDVKLEAPPSPPRRAPIDGARARETIAAHAGNVSAAARSMGLARTTLRALLEREAAAAEARVARSDPEH